LNNKKQINESDVIIIPNSGDENCFYKCISQFYHNKEEYHIYYRKLICEFINSKKVHEMNQYAYLPDNYNNKTLLYNDYFNKMILTGEYTEEYEFINACLSIRCNIFIY